MSADEVLNGASYQSAKLGPGIAPGSIFVIPGRGLGPGELNVASQPYPTRLPDEAGGTEVEFQNAETGDAFSATLIHSVFFQVSGIVPPEMPPGPYSATVSYQGNSASTTEFFVVPSAPGLFTLSMRGFGPGVIQNYESPGSTPLNQLTHAALPEGHLIIWGTGLGEATASAGNGSIAVATEKDVWVEFESQRIRPSYAGPAPGFPGLDQINVRLPAGELSARGCYVPFRVIANGTASNIVTASVSETPGTCEHPLGFSTETLRHLDTGGTVSVGEIQFSRHAVFDTSLIPGADNTGSGFASATFYRADAQRVVITSGLHRRPPLFGCRPVTGLAGAIFWFNDSAFPRGLDAGASLTATGPAGQTLLLEKTPQAQFFAGTYVGPNSLGGNSLQPGPWKISGTGGVNVAAFEVTVPVLPRFFFAYPKVVQSDAPVTVSWPTAGLQDSQIVTIDLSVNITVPDDESSAATDSAGITCQAPAPSGRLTIPVDVLQRFPSEHDGVGSIRFGIESVPAVFQADGLDYGVARMSVSETRSIKVE